MTESSIIVHPSESSIISNSNWFNCRCVVTVQDRKTKVGTGIRLLASQKESSQEAQFRLCCLPHPLPHETGPSAFTRWGQQSCPVCSEESPPPMLGYSGTVILLSFCPTLTGLLSSERISARGCVDGGSGLAETHGEDDTVLRAATQCPLQGRGETKTCAATVKRWGRHFLSKP